MIQKVADTMVGIEGKKMRGVTWVRGHEAGSGEWGTGGPAMTAEAIRSLQIRD